MWILSCLEVSNSPMRGANGSLVCSVDLNGTFGRFSASHRHNTDFRRFGQLLNRKANQGSTRSDLNRMER
jgi:hypothetical protein